MARLTRLAATAAAAASLAHASSATLDDVCTVSYVQSSLPDDDYLTGVSTFPDTVTAAVVTNASISGENFFPDAVIDFCNVTFAYTHRGRNDTVLVNYWLPAPANFANRFLATGGGGFAINSGTTVSGSLPGGVMYGAVAGLTDGGFGSFDTEVSSAILIENGTINYDALYMFGYQGIHEMTLLGQELTQTFYNSSSTKLYSYYQGCSEGGREGMSQLQRFHDQFDGLAIGAPALRYAFQQVQHLWAGYVQKKLDTFPSTCEFSKIMNATIAACDKLDGKEDGVIGRSDLCALEFDLQSIVGEAYSCAADFTISVEYGAGAEPVDTPAVSGNVSQEAVTMMKTILAGPKDSEGRQMYFSYQPGAYIDDSVTEYDSTTDTWGLDISALGGEFVTLFLEKVELDNLPTLDGVTADTLKHWIMQAWTEFEDTLQTTWPDLTLLAESGAKILHFHGEQDDSIPTASSVRYYESVRSIMYGDLNTTASYAAMDEFYRLFLVPGGAHCSPNTAQPNGPWPQTNLQVLIDWVEAGVAPATLNGTILQGDQAGDNQQICPWPTRPYWSNDTAANPDCVHSDSIEAMIYDLDAFRMPVY
ncbi:hypothetical protein ASPZODRAFT_159412 [Penicilliopsis zonata CBS 506.65]|uniref:Carboxylic ester hydrolase n=1 Tax=Penicilliopsis zonata CBS 506.65 TaxID=1073090 RepID=A0A1L9SHI5_9EURO|nr:hypothetical protein ASPZODRAFT_159412 [Penicilliopsis zonata CBS 506.65]OJJ46566.1 hypothetical protein ASPZODRAFT_159412 [Penicilliopsis zonata CBS 506.65]